MNELGELGVEGVVGRAGVGSRKILFKGGGRPLGFKR